MRLKLSFMLAILLVLILIPTANTQIDVLGKIKGVFGEITISGQPNFIPPRSFELPEGDVRYGISNFEGMKNAIFSLKEGKLEVRFDEAGLITVKQRTYPLLNRTNEDKAKFVIDLQKQEIERVF